MAGLIQQSLPATQATPPANPAAPGGQPVTEEIINRVVIAAKKILSQPEIRQQLATMIKGAPDPVTGVAQATIFLMKALFDKSKGTMPPKAIVPAGAKVIVDVARIGEAAGLFKVTPQLLAQSAVKARELMMAQTKQPTAQAQPAPVGA